MSGDKKAALSGGMWTSVSTAVIILSQFARLMILTRFLEKSDFGVVTIINMLISLCLTFTDLGFSSVIMYKKKLSNEEFSSLFWSQLIIFTFIYIILSLFSPLISDFYKEPSLSYLIPIASLTIIFQAFGKLYDSILQKQYQFKLIAYRNIISNIISLISAFILAWQGYGIYSLIISTLISSIIGNTWNFMSGLRVQNILFLLQFNKISPLIKIGGYQTGTRILDFISDKLDIMIIGKLLGTETLGVYGLCKSLVLYLVEFIRTVVSKVALPIISNNNQNEESVKSKFLIITKVVAYLCHPLCITLAVFSSDILSIVYGNNYVNAAPIVSVFAIIAMFNCICSLFDILGIAKGRTDLNFKNTVFRIIIATPIVIITSLISINAVVCGQLLITITQSIFFWYIVVQKTYPIPFKRFISEFGKMSFCLMINGFLLYCIKSNNFFSLHFSFIPNMLIYFGLFVSILILNIFLFFRSDIVYFRHLFRM